MPQRSTERRRGERSWVMDIPRAAGPCRGRCGGNYREGIGRVNPQYRATGLPFCHDDPFGIAGAFRCRTKLVTTQSTMPMNTKSAGPAGARHV